MNRDSKTPTIEQLVKKATEGDKHAFEQLVRHYEKGVYNLAYSRTGNRDDALDAAQECFLRAYRSLPSFRGESAFSTWLYRICFNCTNDMIKKNAVQNAATTPLEFVGEDGEEMSHEIADFTYDPERSALDGERSATVRGAIASLDDKYRVPLVLRDINGLSYKRISQVLELELGTVKSRIKRARDMLGNILKGRGLI
ncbi:MAG: RNA polymerase sigma factor [Eubacteriales bacterium]